MRTVEQWADYVFGLPALTQLAIFAVHGLVVFGLSLGRPRAGALALALLAMTTIAYWSLGLVDDPYRHLDKLDPMTWLE